MEIGARRLPESHFRVFLAPGWKLAPGGLQTAILQHFWPRLEIGARSPPERLFAAYLKLAPGGVQRAILQYF